MSKHLSRLPKYMYIQDLPVNPEGGGGVGSLTVLWGTAGWVTGTKNGDYV